MFPIGTEGDQKSKAVVNKVCVSSHRRQTLSDTATSPYTRNYMMPCGKATEETELASSTSTPDTYLYLHQLLKEQLLLGFFLCRKRCSNGSKFAHKKVR